MILLELLGWFVLITFFGGAALMLASIAIDVGRWVAEIARIIKGGAKHAKSKR